MLSASCQLRVIAWRTASMFGATGAFSENLADTISGSSSRGRYKCKQRSRPWNQIAPLFARKSNNPAMGAALAGSTKIPSVAPP
jgi:hypothetical protein